MARIVETMAQAEADGRDGLAAGRAAYPGTPKTVFAEAWWQRVEKTIDGTIIDNALITATAKQGETVA